MKAILQGFYQKEHFWLRLGVVLLAVFGMGFALSLLLLVDMGTDPCSMMSKAISAKIGMSFGNWQALMNTVILFILTAALYMDVDMGTAPYDAIPIIISGHLPKVPFKVIRIAFDFSVTMIGFSFGGKIGAMTVIMILALGPVIQWLGDIMKKHFPALTGEG